MPQSIVPNGHDRAADRAAINRANAQKSTGPRTAAGKQRSSLNALRHGLTGHTIVLPTEDHSAYQRHSQAFLDEYQPSDDGFVFSKAEIESYIGREERWQQANDHELSMHA